MTFKQLSIVTALLLLISACSSPTAYRKPAPPVPDKQAFVSLSNELTSQQQPARQWWRLYQDEHLNQLVQQALQANKRLQLAAANIRKARAALAAVDSERLPETQLSGGVTYGDASQAGGVSSGHLGNEQWTQSASLGVAWEIDMFSRIGQAISAAEADVAATIAAQDVVRVSVAADTTRAYLNACTSAYAMGIAEQSLQTSLRQRQLVEANLQAGIALQSDYERASAEVERVNAQLEDLQAQRQAALYALSALLALPPTQVPTVARECQQAPALVAALPVGDAASLLRRRPDLRQAERQLAAANAELNVATADLYPRISIGASVGYMDNDQIASDDVWSYFVGPLVSWYFPNRQRAQARLEQSRAELQARYASFEQQVLDALAEVETALSRVVAETRRQQALVRASDHLQRAYELQQQRYQAGTVSYTDVLVTQRALLDARQAHALSQQRLAAVRVDLFKSLAGGWQRAEPQHLARSFDKVLTRTVNSR